MADDFYEGHVDTDEIEDLVVEILRRYNKAYPEDITDRVFLVIEHDANKLKRYKMFAGEDIATANSWIGRVVKDYTGLKVKGTCADPKSTLIKTYSILGR
jgi:hypothetical protein